MIYVTVDWENRLLKIIVLKIIDFHMRIFEIVFVITWFYDMFRDFVLIMNLTSYRLYSSHACTKLHTAQQERAAHHTQYRIGSQKPERVQPKYSLQAK